jgi:hypothetical protein
MIMSFLMVIILPLIVGAGAIFAGRAKRWQPRLSEPHCAKCEYDLRGHLLQPDGPRVCPECGADLTLAGAVNFGKAAARPKTTAAVSIAASIFVVLFVGFSYFIPRLVVPRVGPAAVVGKTNAALLTDLKGTVGQPWTWQELTSRFNRGNLTSTEVDRAIDELIVWMGKQRAQSGWVGPLPWSGDFVKAVTPSLSAEKQLAMYQGYYGSDPKIKVSRRVREGKPVSFDVQWGGPFNLPGAKFVKALREVRSEDGKKLRAHSMLAGTSDEVDWLSADGPANLMGKIAVDLPEGEHELTFVVAGGVLPEGSELVGIANRPGQKERWQKPLATWEATEKVKVMVVGKGEEVAQLVTDPAMDPVRTGEIRPPRILVKKARQGVSVQVKWNTKGSAVDVLMSAAMRVNGKEERLGMLSIHGSQVTPVSEISMKSLPAEVKEVDVILRPDSESASNFIDMEKIWGKEIVFERVALERYDVDVEKP